ncbi:MAG: formylglycine-generating enzyme family protein [Pseudonocardiaceae bacterium]
MGLEWIEIPAGTCRFGDAERPVPVPVLEWTRSPITYAQLDHHLAAARGDHPVTGMSQTAATKIATVLGARLPRSVEWEWMAAGPHRRLWPWGEQAWDLSRANLRGSLRHTTTPVGEHPAGATPEGLLDVAGNVWEWTATPIWGDGFVLRGGSFASPPLYARCTFLNAAPAELCSPGIGLRVVRQP